MTVAVTEESIARAVFRDVLERVTESKTVLVVSSAAVFAVAHWGGGFGSMASAFFFGIVLMLLYLRTGSILPGIAVHYVVNVEIFS